eukprot:gnl/Dysnectes_brevis/220_a250_3089.p1 GENE.gnl/Dysnectes_brevis/220_a250_3089~~gnl/Dysnectes_brevis/220_a250_3089.p1  ORF type:complete len:511 (+),score=151.27 gnl/Dysnectes_brevis/220_a250_3089:1591-3123(+)
MSNTSLEEMRKTLFQTHKDLVDVKVDKEADTKPEVEDGVPLEPPQTETKPSEEPNPAKIEEEPVQVVEGEDPLTVCHICNKSSNTADWICCDKCESWVHARCDRIGNVAALELHPSFQYFCPRCRTTRTPHPCKQLPELAGDFAAEFKPPSRSSRRSRRPSRTRKEEEEPAPSPRRSRRREERRAGKKPEETISVLNWLRGASGSIRHPQSSSFDALQKHVASPPVSRALPGNDEDLADITTVTAGLVSNLQSSPPNLMYRLAAVKQKQLTGRLAHSLIGKPVLTAPEVPEMPSDADLRGEVAVSFFNYAVQSLERSRMSYLRGMLPEYVRVVRGLADACGHVPEQPAGASAASADIAEEPPRKRKAASSDAPPQGLTRHQWRQLCHDGVETFPGIVAVRSTLLNALVASGFGTNVLQESLGEEVIDKMIRLGLDAARVFIRRQSAVDAAAQDGSYDCKVVSDAVGDDAGSDAEMSDISEWDLNETPESVVWALKEIRRGYLESYLEKAE